MGCRASHTAKPAPSFHLSHPPCEILLSSSPTTLPPFPAPHFSTHDTGLVICMHAGTQARKRGRQAKNGHEDQDFKDYPRIFLPTCVSGMASWCVRGVFPFLIVVAVSLQWDIDVYLFSFFFFSFLLCWFRGGGLGEMYVCGLLWEYIWTLSRLIVQ